MMSKINEAYLFIKTQTTGLNSRDDEILEVSAVLTDVKTNNALPAFHMVLSTSTRVLNNLSEWAKENHSKTGLLDEVKQSTNTYKDLERELEYYIINHCPDLTHVTLVGNSIGFDKGFLFNKIPNLMKKFHRITVDITSFQIVVKNWTRLIYNKNYSYRAKPMVYESINELRSYINLMGENIWQ